MCGPKQAEHARDSGSTQALTPSVGKHYSVCPTQRRCKKTAKSGFSFEKKQTSVSLSNRRGEAESKDF
jgi:hypothetical protein